MLMLARVLPAANPSEACLAPVTKPTTVRLAYEDVVVVAVVEPIGRDSLIVQYTVDDEVERTLEIWGASLHYDVVAARWRMRIRSTDELHRSEIEAVCSDVLRAIGAASGHGEEPKGFSGGEGC